MFPTFYGFSSTFNALSTTPPVVQFKNFQQFVKEISRRSRKKINTGALCGLIRFFGFSAIIAHIGFHFTLKLIESEICFLSFRKWNFKQTETRKTNFLTFFHPEENLCAFFMNELSLKCSRVSQSVAEWNALLFTLGCLADPPRYIECIFYFY